MERTQEELDNLYDKSNEGLTKSLRFSLDSLSNGAFLEPAIAVDSEFSAVCDYAFTALAAGDYSTLDKICDSIKNSIEGSKAEDFPDLRYDQRLALRLHVLRLALIRARKEPQ